MSKKEQLLESILNTVNDLDIAWYLKEEVSSLFKHLHYYKLKNIHSNISTLQEYLIFLDCHNTQQICLLESVEALSLHENSTKSLTYYISQKGLELVWEDLMQKKLSEEYYNLSYVMQAIKGFLLLTADEFCNATPTRMSISRILRNKQLDLQKNKPCSSCNL